MFKYRFDYDFEAAFEYNPQYNLDIADVVKILAVWEGENDGDAWRWIVSLKNGKFAYLHGSCDFTGWDCQSGLSNDQGENPFDLVALEDNLDVQKSLMKQLRRKSSLKTWRQAMDEKLKIGETKVLSVEDMVRIANEKKATKVVAEFVEHITDVSGVFVQPQYMDEQFEIAWTEIAEFKKALQTLGVLKE